MSILLPLNWSQIQAKSRRSQLGVISKRDKSDYFSTFSTSAEEVEKVFIDGLVKAGQCRRHAQLCTNTATQHRKRPSLASTQCPPAALRTPASRSFSTKTGIGRAAGAAAYELTREEMHHIVNTEVQEEIDADIEPPGRKWRYVDSAPEEYLEENEQDEDISDILGQLEVLLQDPESPHEQLWQAYQQLPTPRASRLPRQILRDLFHHLSVVEHKSHETMLRYFSLLEDALAASVPLTATQWTSAISFAGRFVKHVTIAEVEHALQLWRQMENQGQVRGTSVTFNVLFDIATKARKFVLAEMIMKEMQARELPLTRFFRTSLIMHYGMRRDGEGVRTAYKDLIDAGEIVDSTVITSVVKALIMSGEAVAAEQVFARSKQLHSEKMNAKLPPKNWRMRRQIGRMLDSATRDRARVHYYRAQAEAFAPLAPQLATYKALIFHYAVDIGDLDRVTELIDEMKQWSVQMHGSLYLYIFNGFRKHGGVLYTSWTRRRLEQTWKALIAGVEAEKGRWNGTAQSAKRDSPSVKTASFDFSFPSVERNSPASQSQPPAGSTGELTRPSIYPTRALVLLILRAFLKVAGPERTWDIWHEAQERWSPPEDDSQYIEEQLEVMLPDRDQSDRSPEDQMKSDVEGLLGLEDDIEAETAEDVEKAFGAHDSEERHHRDDDTPS